MERHTFENDHGGQRSADSLLDELRDCRSRERWDRACAREIAEAIVDSCRRGTFKFDQRLLPELLEECFIATYFADYPHQGAAREVVELYERLARENRSFRDGFLRNEIRVRTNFSLLT